MELKTVFKKAIKNISMIFNRNKISLTLSSRHRLNNICCRLQHCLKATTKFKIELGFLRCVHSNRKIKLTKLLAALSLPTKSLFKFILLSPFTKYTQSEKLILKDFFQLSGLKTREVSSLKIRKLLK